MPIYYLIEYSDNYSKTLESLCQYYSVELALNESGVIVNFPGHSASFKFKISNGKKYVEIMVPLKYLTNFWWTFEMPLINCKTNLILTWSNKCVLSNDTKATAFAEIDTKRYFLVVILSTQDNAKLLQQLKSILA